MGKKSSLTFTKKLLIILLLLILFILVSLYVLYGYCLVFKNSRLVWTDFAIQGMSDGGDQYIITTKTCSIPRTPVMPTYFRNEWRTERIPECDYEIKNFVLAEDQELVSFYPREPDELCCLQEISQSTEKDGKFSTLSPCIYSSEATASVKNIETFAIKCNTSINVEARFPIKPKVQQKLDYWAKMDGDSINKPMREDGGKPPNILMIGIDSVSRLHAHRSLPKTLKVLKDMKFVEFKGYHSAGPSTLDNFMPLLTGLTLGEARKECAANWGSNFDDCPFLWKRLDALHYVTNFIEDGEGSFNWGGNGGFKIPPTDYYIRHLFQALEKMRLKSFGPNATWWTREMYADCVSLETVPEFLLRYTGRFVQKFSNHHPASPFFSFTWLAYPFHEHIYALRTFDENLLEFFETLREDPVTLDNSLIIFFSDHGDRTSFFQSSSIEGFIERSLPPLFIRVPTILEQTFGDQSFRLNLVKNSRRLTTPWDLHQTILHLISLFNHHDDHDLKPPRMIETFSPILPDRSSLFHAVPLDRTCDSVNLPEKNCVCNTFLLTDEEEKEGKKNNLGTKVAKILNFELNKVVQNSNYTHLCRRWRVNNKSKMTFRFLTSQKNESQYIVVFRASPGGAIFEARIVVFSKDDNNYGNETKLIDTGNDYNNNFGGFEHEIGLVGSISRINLYNEQSDCIKFETDADKDMKQFCVCKK